jgi:hypothetical protein
MIGDWKSKGPFGRYVSSPYHGIGFFLNYTYLYAIKYTCYDYEINLNAR